VCRTQISGEFAFEAFDFFAQNKRAAIENALDRRKNISPLPCEALSGIRLRYELGQRHFIDPLDGLHSPCGNTVAVPRPLPNRCRPPLSKTGILLRKVGDRGAINQSRPATCLRGECVALAKLAERVGFEPTVRFPAHTLSKRAP